MICMIEHRGPTGTRAAFAAGAGGAQVHGLMKENDVRKTGKEIWRQGGAGMSAGQMLRRIDTLLSSATWEKFCGSLLRRHSGVSGLKVAEVGCGTGTMALVLGLLGAEVTLIDFNASVLEEAARIYACFGCKARRLTADCLEPPGVELRGTFDIVVSGGLAEHFEGDYREKCFAYHRELLKPGGMAMIGVPNRLSPFYQWIRIFRMATGTWELDIEIPFSDSEMRRIAAKTGFIDCLVFGTAPLSRDVVVYSRGFISAIADLLPAGMVGRARRFKAGIESRLSSAESPGIYAARRCREKFESIAARGEAVRPGLLDKFSSGLILIGYREARGGKTGPAF